MKANERAAQIEMRLRESFAPDLLEVIDESHLHVGHAGARDGRGHFFVRIVSASFAGVTPIRRHRMVYAALADLMQNEIHALAIDANPPS